MKDLDYFTDLIARQAGSAETIPDLLARFDIDSEAFRQFAILAARILCEGLPSEEWSATCYITGFCNGLDASLPDVLQQSATA